MNVTCSSWRRWLWRTAKWMALMLSIVIVGLTITDWCGFAMRSGYPLEGGRCVCISGGLATVVWSDISILNVPYHGEPFYATFGNSPTFERRTWRLRWWEWDEWPWPKGMILPTWVASLAVGLPTGLLWWHDRRRRQPGVCAKCGYNLSGLPSPTRCPECGTAAKVR